MTASVCILTSEDLEPATTDEKEHVMFVFLGLAYLSQYECYCFLLYPTLYPGFTQTHKPFASASPVFGLQMPITIPSQEAL